MGVREAGKDRKMKTDTHIRHSNMSVVGSYPKLSLCWKMDVVSLISGQMSEQCVPESMMMSEDHLSLMSTYCSRRKRLLSALACGCIQLKKTWRLLECPGRKFQQHFLFAASYSFLVCVFDQHIR